MPISLHRYVHEHNSLSYIETSHIYSQHTDTSFIDCLQGGLVQKFIVSILSAAFERIFADSLFLGRSRSSERHSMGQATISVKIFFGLCCLQHNNVCPSIRRLYHSSDVFAKRSSKQRDKVELHSSLLLQYSTELHACACVLYIKITFTYKICFIPSRASTRTCSMVVTQCCCS